MEDIRTKYAHIKQAIKENIERREIDIPKVIRSYAQGMSKERIQILYRLEDVELSYILSNYVTFEVIEKRNQLRTILNGKNCNIMGLPNYARKTDQEPVLTIQEAIALVEGHDVK